MTSNCHVVFVNCSYLKLDCSYLKFTYLVQSRRIFGDLFEAKGKIYVLQRLIEFRLFGEERGA